MGTVSDAMRQAVEGRRRELRLSVGELAELAGLSRQGIANVREGRQRDYHESTIFGIARALRWDVDWYERILAGEEPRPAPVRDELTPDDRTLTDRVAMLEAQLALVQTRHDELASSVERIASALASELGRKFGRPVPPTG